MSSLPSAVEKPQDKKSTSKKSSKQNQVVTEKELPTEYVEPVEQWQDPEIESADGLVEISLPLAIVPEYFPRRTQTHLRNLTRKQRFGLRVLTQGLKLEGETLASGSEIKSPTNAIRSLLESIADAAKDAFTKGK